MLKNHGIVNNLTKNFMLFEARMEEVTAKRLKNICNDAGSGKQKMQRNLSLYTTRKFHSHFVRNVVVKTYTRQRKHHVCRFFKIF